MFHSSLAEFVYIFFKHFMEKFVTEYSALTIQTKNAIFFRSTQMKNVWFYLSKD